MNNSYKTNTFYLDIILLITIFSINAFSQGPLSDGSIYKLKVNKTGIYKIDNAVFTELGIDVSNLSPEDIAIYGFGYGMLPQPNNKARPSSLTEISIKFVGEDNNKISSSDIFIFYGEGPNALVIDSVNHFISTEFNLYDEANYYFLKIGGQNSKNRVVIENRTPSTPQSFSSLIEVVHHEKDLITALSEPSGRYWFGEDLTTESSQAIVIDFNPINTSTEMMIKCGVMAKSRAESTFSVSLLGTERGEVVVRGARDFNSYRYGRQGYMENNLFKPFTINDIGDNLNLDVSYSKPQSDSEGYIDYFTINTKRNIATYKNNFVYHEILPSNVDGATISINTVFEYLWDVSDPLNITSLNISNNKITTIRKQQLTSIAAFNIDDLISPELVGNLSNQNIRDLQTPNLLIISYGEYLNQANKLAQHRSTTNSIDVRVVDVEQIYNEYSSGRQDISAIRDFIRTLYTNNSQKLKNVLLFGQGSYDYKGIKQEGGSKVAIYESRDVLQRTKTYSSDDYIGFLDENEGFWAEDIDGSVENYDLEIGIGRLPARTLEDAEILVDRIINYDTLSTNLDSWKKRVLFVADDGDTNTHQGDANDLATYVEETFSDFDSKRVYIDNYPKESTPSGALSPESNESINNWVNNEGVLIVNYSGHGSITNWAEEAILTVDMINNFSNYTKLPLFLTATCEFGRYDNPAIMSSAERLLFNPKGGAISLLTTTRPVYASSNFKINKAFYDYVFLKDQNNNYSSLGQVMMRTKNNSLSGVNNRNFALLGDPSMMLDLSTREINLTTLNHNQYTSTDTIKALDSVLLEGEVTINGVKDKNFNGNIYLTLYEKVTESSTRGNDGSVTVFNYLERKYQLFRGVVSVIEGDFAFDFVVPKDIRYAYGTAKLSFYANNTSFDAIGSDVDIIIGGTSSNPVTETVPPEIKMYFNGDSSASTIPPDSYLYAEFFDESGINISGIGTGHDIKLSMDNGSEEWILNEFLMPKEGVENTYSLVFPLNDLEEGEHSFTIEVWDVLNNRAEKTINVIVSPISELEITDLVAFPNPIDENMDLRFSNNVVGQDITVTSNIIAMNGNTVLSTVNEFENVEEITTLQYKGLRSHYGLISGMYVVQLIIECHSLNLSTFKTTRIVLF
ncbi:type IX secretion system sortase PorU [Flammeovirga pectinis]|uniref:Type IX secretion system sortase PorU n=1 Tax=Flammeovirga pectinis TaxID=2494373 RepID=A0A3S9NXU4_9BACT|nr:type IX secretion system sortase PorU [Flammeovirga pectinis]AZQ60685.1 type IX secretion system sortase PorU [Flammeovirga pectinis]